MKKQNFEIIEVSAKETYPLRHRVLKPHLKQYECGNPGDEDSTSLHLALLANGEIVSVSSFIKVPFEVFPEAKTPYQLRGMATAPEFQGQGLGSLLLQQGEDKLRQMNCDCLWFRARIKAFPFYEKLGFQFHGELFEMPFIGPHKYMYKFLVPR